MSKDRSTESGGLAGASLVFVTAGELPRTNNVLFSQVYSIAARAAQQCGDVRWYAFLPFEALKERGRYAEQLDAVRERCAGAGVRFTSWYAGFTLFRLLMLRLRGLYAMYCAKTLLRRLFREPLRRSVVINARSYYATEIALRVKKELRRRGHDVRVCFDMRGILSLTYPASYPDRGFGIYGNIRAWEASLLERSDVALNNRIAAIRLADIEYGKKIEYLPVSGFARSMLVERSFEEVWRRKTIAFVGQFSPKFHDLRVMEEIAEQLAPFGFGVEIITDRPDSAQSRFPVRSVPYSEMPKVFAAMSAVVIPGRSVPPGLFERMALRAYSAPTKMSEALSMGVPVIVGSCFPEIARFVEESGCGLVFDIERGKFRSAGSEQLSDAAFWQALNEAAARQSHEFSQENVMDIYLRAWAVS